LQNGGRRLPAVGECLALTRRLVLVQRLRAYRKGSLCCTGWTAAKAAMDVRYVGFGTTACFFNPARMTAPSVDRTDGKIRSERYGPHLAHGPLSRYNADLPSRESVASVHILEGGAGMHRQEPIQCIMVVFGLVGALISSQVALGQPCEPGSWSEDGNEPCTPCPAGTYSDAAGATSCDWCPPGTYSTGGSSSCWLCPPGTYSTAGSSSCQDCPPGTYADSPGSPECADCPVDTYQPDAGATECLECPPGTVQPNPGQVECIPDLGIPTVSTWGMCAMTLLMLAAGTVVLRRRRVAT